MRFRRMIAAAVAAAFLNPTAVGALNAVSVLRNIQVALTDEPLEAHSSTAAGAQGIGFSDGAIVIQDLGTTVNSALIVGHSESFGGIPALPNASIVGNGNSLVGLLDANVTEFIFGQADSLLEVVFESTVSGNYRLQGSLGWHEDSPDLDGYAQVQLYDLTGGFVVSDIVHYSSTPGTTTFNDIFNLAQGRMYQMRGASQISGSVFGVATELVTSAEWSFTLEPVPEPAALPWLVIGTSLCAFARRKHR